MAIDVPNSHVGWLMKIEGFLQKLKNNRVSMIDGMITSSPANGTNQLPAQSYFYQKDLIGCWVMVLSGCGIYFPDMGMGTSGDDLDCRFSSESIRQPDDVAGWLRNPALVDGNPMILAMGLVQDFATIDSMELVNCENLLRLFTLLRTAKLSASAYRSLAMMWGR
jgi:hypothetical protein